MIELALGYIGHIFVAPLIWLAVYDYNNHRLMGQGGMTLLEDDSILLSAYPLHPGEILEQVVIEQRPISIPDMSQEPRMGFWQKEANRLGGIQGCMIYPIRSERQCVGILMMGSQVWGVTATEEEKALLGILLGQLGASFAQLQVLWRQQSERRVDDPLIALGSRMRERPSLSERTELVISTLKEFIGVTRVEVYWLDRKTSFFVPNSIPQGEDLAPVKTKQRLTHVSIRDLGDMYYTLCDGQVVTAADATGSTRAEVPLRLMQQLKVQAILVAPLLLEGDLLGFISVESDIPKEWEDVERRMTLGAANLLALARPLDRLESALSQVEGYKSITAEIARSIYTEADLQETLKKAISALGEQLQASACAALLYEPESGVFTLFHEFRKEGRGTFPKQFGSLSDQDWQDLVDRAVIVAENYTQDLRLFSWKKELDALGVKSVMFAHTGFDQQSHSPSLEGAILVTHQHLRSWTREERQLLRTMAQQVGFLLRYLRLQQLQRQQEQLLTGVLSSSASLPTFQSLPDLFKTAAETIFDLTKSALVVVVSWLPGDTQGQVQAVVKRDPKYQVTEGAEVDIYRDPLIAQCFHSELGILLQSAADLSPMTKAWMPSQELETVLTVPLGTYDMFSPPIGILVAGHEGGRYWSSTEQSVVSLLAQTTGEIARRIISSQALQDRLETLSELNWYKHRRLLDIQTHLLDSLRRLGQVPETPGNEAARWAKVVEIARGIRDLTASSQNLLQAEAWQVSPESTKVPLASLIRRSLKRLDPLVQKKKLWPRIHGDAGISIVGDPGRLEMLIYEIWSVSALRSPLQGYLDVWLQVEEGCLEILSADDGEVDPALIEALEMDPEEAQYIDPLVSSPLNTSPGLELSLCQRIMIRMGGQLSFYQTEEGRNISRLVIPISDSEDGSKEDS
jgi:GAF domain-containing protein